MADLVAENSNNTILITGGATGIGYALAEGLAKVGNQVIITGRREDKLKEAKEKIGKNVHYRVNDVATAAERVALVETVTKDFPSLNVVILNAGVQQDLDFSADSKHEWEELHYEIAINLDAPIHLCKLFIPHLSKVGKTAYLMTVSSGLAFAPKATYPVYCATKAAIHSFSISLRYQLKNTNIKVIEIVPPAVDSELNAPGRTKRNQLSTGTTSEQFAAGVFEGFKKNEDEIGYGFANNARNGSRQDLDKMFSILNP
eukprot:Phypoly_transcript_16232.p1 GENE.Phypoly_transcript_16232~~Phypoly_transcript_16232.p1  ORF type:complete len:258 (+),score=51.41 Phypoly_transcript_16232:88-861(+)